MFVVVVGKSAKVPIKCYEKCRILGFVVEIN